MMTPAPAAAAATTATSIAALFIHQVNPHGFLGLSAIHLFVPLTLLGVFGAASYSVAQRRRELGRDGRTRLWLAQGEHIARSERRRAMPHLRPTRRRVLRIDR